MDEREAIARLKHGDINGLETLVKVYQVQAVRAASGDTRPRPGGRHRAGRFPENLPALPPIRYTPSVCALVYAHCG